MRSKIAMMLFAALLVAGSSAALAQDTQPVMLNKQQLMHQDQEHLCVLRLGAIEIIHFAKFMKAALKSLQLRVKFLNDFPLVLAQKRG